MPWDSRCRWRSKLLCISWLRSINELSPVRIGALWHGVSVLVNERDGRWTMDDGRWTMDDGRWTMDDGRWTMDDGRWTMDDRRSTIDDRRSTIDDGRWTIDDGRSTMDDRRSEPRDVWEPFSHVADVVEW